MQGVASEITLRSLQKRLCNDNSWVWGPLSDTAVLVFGDRKPVDVRVSLCLTDPKGRGCAGQTDLALLGRSAGHSGVFELTVTIQLRTHVQRHLKNKINFSANGSEMSTLFHMMS